MEKGLVFGLNIGDLLEIYDHSLQSWKMSGCLFTGDYAKSSEVLPKSGIMLNGKIYEQRTWVRRTGGNGFGLLPTPQARAQQDCPAERKRNTPCLESHINIMEKTTGQLNPQFVEWLMGYPLNFTDMRVDLQINFTEEWTDLKDSEIQLSLK